MKKFTKILKEKEVTLLESKSKIKSEIKGNDYQMVSGIIDILKKVKDKENRMEIAEDMISQFKRENIKFDYNEFLNSLK
jgi:type III secretion system FlhB-like substrate exporter